jgi:exopolysaccharide production protein ExoQ
VWVLFIIMFLMDAVLRQRAFEEKSADWQILLRVGSWSLGCLAILAVGLGRSVVHSLRPDTFLWILFYLWLGYTASYSPNVVYSAVCVFSIVAVHFFCVTAFGRVEEVRLIAALVAACAVMAVASMIVFFVQPSLGKTLIWSGGFQVYSNRLAGLAGNGNGVGRIMAIGLILTTLYWSELRARYGHWVYAAVAACAIALLWSNSRTALGVTLLICALYVFVTPRRLPMLLLGVTLAILAVVVIMPFSDELLSSISRTGSKEEVLSGNNRLLIWYTVIHLAEQQPWFGYGYGSSTFILSKYKDYIEHVAPHAHNTLLQIWFSSGWIGVGLFLTAYVVSFISLVLRRHRRALLLMLFVLLMGITETGAFQNAANVITMMLFLALTLPSPKRVAAASPAPHMATPPALAIRAI